MPDDTQREWPMDEEIEWTAEDEPAANRALARLIREDQARKARRMRESQRPRRRSYWRGAPHWP